MKITTKYMINDNSPETDKIVDEKLYNALKTYFASPLTFEEFTSTTDNQTVSSVLKKSVLQSPMILRC